MMWPSALDYNFSSSGYTPANNNTSSSFFTNSFSSSDNEIKMNDSNFSQFQHQLAMSLTGGFPFMSQNIQPSSPSSLENTPQMRAKKKPNPVPVERKNNAYYERRKKNNQSAQKSRNERRRREQENVLRIGQLEQENGVLRNVIQQLQSKINFQDLQLQSVPRNQPIHNPPPIQQTNQSSNNTPCNENNQILFPNQMLMNSY